MTVVLRRPVRSRSVFEQPVNRVAAHARKPLPDDVA